MAKHENTCERAIIFIHEGSSYPCIKRAWFTDEAWREFLFKRFDSHERDYCWVNDTTVLVYVEKGN